MYYLPSLMNLESAVGGQIEDLQISGVESLSLDGAEALQNMRSLKLRACGLKELNRLEFCKNLTVRLKLLNISENKQIKTL